jgi:hypothetical protein
MHLPMIAWDILFLDLIWVVTREDIGSRKFPRL